MNFLGIKTKKLHRFNAGKYKLLLLIIFVILFIIVLYLTDKSIISQDYQLNSHQYRVQFENVTLKKKLANRDRKIVCEFTESSDLDNVVIRTQEEYDNFILQLEQKGFEKLLFHVKNYPRNYWRYSSIKTLNEYISYCQNQYAFTPFDFSQKTLLGQYAYDGGCSVDFNRDVVRDDVNKIVNYSIYTIPSGRCEMLGTSENWILVPKVPDDYAVNIQVLKSGKKK